MLCLSLIVAKAIRLLALVLQLTIWYGIFLLRMVPI
jgi:hypothetical protein